MAITQAMCTSFKVELLQGLHDFRLSGGDNIKIALYDSTANLSALTTVYTATGEVSSANYSAGGKSLTRIDPTSSGATAFLDFEDIDWTNVTFTARGALIYNATDGNRAIAVLNFGSDQVVSNGTFTVQFPAPDSSNAIIRIGS